MQEVPAIYNLPPCQSLSSASTEQLTNLSDVLFAPLAAARATAASVCLGVPSHLIELILLVEDKRFFLHFGIDPIAIGRALTLNLRGCHLQGASTLSQQLYSMRLTPSERRSLRGSVPLKLKQICWSVLYALTHSRASILRQYVATVYLGRTYYGIDRAAMEYFGVHPMELTGAQSFFLAERIACPNRAKPNRIANLLRRSAIIDAISRSEQTVKEVTDIYEEKFRCGGDIWAALEK